VTVTDRSTVTTSMTERILVVEDDPRLAEMLSEYLGQAGFASQLRLWVERRSSACPLPSMTPSCSI